MPSGFPGQRHKAKKKLQNFFSGYPHGNSNNPGYIQGNHNPAYAHSIPSQSHYTPSYGTSPSPRPPATAPGYVSNVASTPSTAAPSTYMSTSSGVPSLDNLSYWFDYFDRDRSGQLNKEETVAAVAQTIGSKGALVDIASIRESIYSLWAAFDMDQSGGIDRREFMMEGGLGESLRAMLDDVGPSTSSAPPAGATTYSNSYSSMPTSVHARPSMHMQAPNAHNYPTPPPANPQLQQSANTQGQKLRVSVPAGMSPGELIKIAVPSGEMVTVKIPTYTKWTTNGNGQSTFDIQVPAANPPPNNPTTQYMQQSPSPNHSSQYSQQPSHSYQPSSGMYGSPVTVPTPPSQPFQSWDRFRGISRSFQPFQVKSIPINPSQFIQPSGRRRALIIGINYTGTQAALRGCINDARNMETMLVQQGYPNDSEHMVVLTDDSSSPSNHRPTGANIVRAMQWLVQGVSSGDVLFFHFSGHGSQVGDKTGFEKDGLNETILPVDYKKGQLKDDQLWENLVYPLPNGARLTAVMDCCHSGTGLDLPYEYQLPNRNQYNSFSLNSTAFSNGTWVSDVNTAHSQGDVVLFSGCQDSQTSADVSGSFLSQYQAGGAMTQSFIQAFQSNPMATYPQFLATIHNTLKQRGFSQRPQLTSSQQFDVNSRIFSLVEGIEANRNDQIGRIQRKKYKTQKVSGGSIVDKLLGINPTTAVGILVGAMVLDSLF